MNSTLTALVWKEWREHRWKLVLLTAIMLLPPIVMWRGESSIDFVAPLMLSLLFYLPLATAFVAMGTAAGERSHGTLPLLQALPKRMRLAAAVKLAASYCCLMIPIVVSLLGARLVVSLKSLSDGSAMGGAWRQLDQTSPLGLTGLWVVDMTLWTSLFVASVLLWVAALGVNSESEVRAGAIGLTVVVALWTLFSGGAYLFETYGLRSYYFGESDTRYLLGPLLAMFPGGIASVLTMPQTLTDWAPILLSFVVVHGALAAWFVMRFGVTEKVNHWSPQPARSRTPESDWLADPRSSPLAALAWKQLRESGPVVLAAFAGAMGLLLMFATAVWWEGNWNLEDDFEIIQTAGLSTSFFMLFGFIAGVVGGVGQFATDFEARHFGFWRSRPIDIDQWFWTKIVVGAGMLLVALGLPIFAGSAVLERYDAPFPPGAYALPTVLLAYAAATLAGCLLHQTIYAAILGLGIGVAVSANVATRFEDSAFWLLLAASAGMILLAWWAVRRDWVLSNWVSSLRPPGWTSR